MGLTIKGSFKGSPSYDGGYGTFFRLRANIAKAIMGEDYPYYEEWSRTDDSTPKDRLHELCNKLRSYGETFYEFMTASDCDGKLSYKQCLEIYNLIKDKPGDFSFGYDFYRRPCDEDDIKVLLKECYSHRARLLWY